MQIFSMYFYNILLILAFSLCSASHAVTKSVTPPNHYSSVPSEALARGLWERIDRSSFSNNLEMQTKEEHREQAKILMDYVYKITSLYVLRSNSANLDELIRISIIGNIPAFFPDLCAIEAHSHILTKAAARFDGASLAAKVASRRADKKAALMESERASLSGTYDSGYSAQYYIDLGAAWGQADGKYITYLDEKYIQLATEYNYTNASVSLASIEKTVAKHCAQSEPKIFINRKPRQTSKNEESEVFLVNLPAHKSTAKIPFRTEDTTSVVIAVYDKNSDSYAIKRDQLVKIGLVPEPIKLNLDGPKALDKDLMLIPPPDSKN